MEPATQNENQQANLQSLAKDETSDINEDEIASVSDQENEISTDDDELFEEVTVRPRLFYLLLSLLGILLILLVVGCYLVYPFSSKINGKWENPDIGMVLSSKGNSWNAEIENFQGVSGYTIVYSGKWKAAGVNIYDGKETTVQVHLDKQKIPAEEISKLQKKNPLYKKITDNKKQLKLEYTETGMKKLFNRKSIDNYFHFSLEPITFQKSERVLYLNHSYFSNERIPFTSVD